MNLTLHSNSYFTKYFLLYKFNITLQGNFDPTRLYSSPEKIKTMVTDMINQFGKDKYIVNLGHGILPDIPLENAKAFIDAVKNYKA